MAKVKTTLRGFAKRINKIGIDIEKNADTLVRKVAITVTSSVVLATPVDTGRARANWRTALGAAERGVRDPFATGKKGSTGAQNISGVIAETQRVVAGYQGNGEVFISNNLPYIGPLNTGTSDQAPAGFVEIAVNNGVRAVRQAKVIK